jgi:hypothetical protein
MSKLNNNPPNRRGDLILLIIVLAIPFVFAPMEVIFKKLTGKMPFEFVFAFIEWLDKIIR